MKRKIAIILIVLLLLSACSSGKQLPYTDFEAYYSQCIADISVGDEIFLGKYNNEYLTWTVASLGTNYAILVCDTVVAQQAYNHSPGSANVNEPSFHYNEWPACTLRTWLNSEFLENAFSDQERGKLTTASVPGAGAHKEEEAVSDYVYILSNAEMKAAIAAGWDSGSVVQNKALWLRGSSGTNGISANGHRTGTAYGINEIDSRYGIVPVIWIATNTNNATVDSVFDGTKPTEAQDTNRTSCSSCGGSGKKVVKWYSQGDWGDVSYSSYDCTACNGRGYK